MAAPVDEGWPWWRGRLLLAAVVTACRHQHVIGDVHLDRLVLAWFAGEEGLLLVLPVDVLVRQGHFQQSPPLPEGNSRGQQRARGEHCGTECRH